MSIVTMKHDEKMLFHKYGIGSFATSYLDNVMMCRMLAKIGHSFAVAEIGLDSFSPLLTDLIRNGADRKSMRYIGGSSKVLAAPPNALHALALGYQKIEGKTYLAAKIRLFAPYGGPTFLALIGESAESRVARARRTYFGRISQVFAR